MVFATSLMLKETIHIMCQGLDRHGPTHDENGNKKSVDQWFSDADKKMYKDKKESRKI